MERVFQHKKNGGKNMIDREYIVAENKAYGNLVKKRLYSTGYR